MNMSVNTGYRGVQSDGELIRPNLRDLAVSKV